MNVNEAACQLATGKQPGELIEVTGIFFVYTYKVVSGGVSSNWYAGVGFQTVEFVSRKVR